ncbi:uncharacterized protein LOC115877919 isoform X2 [Sitophilus oryzae]|uniref:Uncharacterized protein LOC115877919 isoform X2 n=1 Tax=Sitophilus oryzae TaxID=7048 RepID=A0A6J2XFK9_SITOR|nr:uncharacterized protein LOC115877919 isoform X2 [Sitophilus oryzae]
MNFQQHVACFIKLLDNNHITEFNKRDVCGALCDKFHLIIIFQYFMRADFKEEDYTPENFFLALTLSHDIYEDTTVLKTIIMGFYYSRKQFVANKLIFQWNKLVLFGRMKYKGYVEKKICNNLIDLVPHKIMAKTRRELHTGFLNNLMSSKYFTRSKIAKI